MNYEEEVDQIITNIIETVNKLSDDGKDRRKLFGRIAIALMSNVAMNFPANMRDKVVEAMFKDIRLTVQTHTEKEESHGYLYQS